jgi:hypothetical protein
MLQRLRAIAAWHYATEYSADSALLQAAVAATLTHND